MKGFTVAVFSKHNPEKNLTSIFVTGWDVLGYDSATFEDNVENLPVYKIVKRVLWGKPHYHVEPMQEPDDDKLGWFANGDTVDITIKGQEVVKLHYR